MLNLFKQLFCRHDYKNKYIPTGYQVRNGVEYLPYLRTCKKCGKQKLVVITKECEMGVIYDLLEM